MNMNVWMLEQEGHATLLFDSKSIMERYIKVSRRDLNGRQQKAPDVWVYGGRATGRKTKVHNSSDLSI